MNLEVANTKILEIFKQYEEKAKLLPKLEYAYDMRHAELYVRSGMGTAALKEAEVAMMIKEEGLGEELFELRSEVRILYYKYQALMEYCKTLRAIMTRDSWQA